MIDLVIEIAGRKIARKYPIYIVAEMFANHHLAPVALGSGIVEKPSPYPGLFQDRKAFFPWNPMHSKPWLRLFRLLKKFFGLVSYAATEREAASRVFRRSLF